ncbi:MAG TPA: DUF58 domain-containing protein [Planctomycetaceae bacterium]|nr:DUF58 domain-containing protein [Planctomycetaceae bacterium]
MSTAGARFTTLLENQVLSRLEKMRLNPLRRRTNRTRGEHQAGKGGTSTEFADYRDYVAGDDVKNVDWNIFARLEKPFVKLYRHEEDLHVVLLVDSSESMRFEGKFDRARQLAAALGTLGLMNGERVSLYTASGPSTQPAFLPPCTGRVSRKRMFDFLERLEAGGDCAVEQSIDAMLSRHRGKGLVIVLSDFLTFGDLQKPFNMLFSSGLEVSAIQILGPTEINPELTGNLRFVDSESGQTLDVSNVGELLSIYHAHRLALEEEVATICRQRSGRFVSISSQEPLESVLFDLLRRRGWIR